jgi:uncharacterized lipoprotein
MLNKILSGLCVLLVCTACASEAKRLKETEYLRTHPTKPVAYPADVDKPGQEKSYVVPELQKGVKPVTEADSPELLALPPRLAGVDLSEDKEEEKAKKPEEPVPEQEDDGFLEGTQ